MNSNALKMKRRYESIPYASARKDVVRCPSAGPLLCAIRSPSGKLHAQPNVPIKFGADPSLVQCTVVANMIFLTNVCMSSVIVTFCINSFSHGSKVCIKSEKVFGATGGGGGLMVA